jgi:hypothetical protein
MSHPIAGVRRKLLRAEHHLKILNDIVTRYKRTEYLLIPKPCDDPDEILFSIKLPKIPEDIALIAGDCIHNLRCVLDHIVWQLAHRTSPNRTPEQRKKNMFPLSLTYGEFVKQVARERLNGLPPKAVTLVETFQPYHAAFDFLGALGELENIDKHRTLVIVASFVHGLYSPEFASLYGIEAPYGASDGHFLDDSTPVLKIHRRFVSRNKDTFGKVNVKAHGSILIGIFEPGVANFGLPWGIEQMAEIIRQRVIPALKVNFGFPHPYNRLSVKGSTVMG